VKILFLVKDAVIEVLKRHIELNNSARGIVIDGYPRTVQQLEEYETQVRIFCCDEIHLLFCAEKKKYLLCFHF